MKIFDSPQGSDAWKKERSGHFTASTFSDLFMGKSTKGYNDAINRVVYERMSGEVVEGYQNDAMRRGNELEPIARQAYELETFSKVKQVGFIELDEWIGVSVDGLVGERGTLEIKCPIWNTMMNYYFDDAIPKDYNFQMQGGLWILERDWSDYFPYHPKLPTMLRRVNRDEKTITEIQERLKVAIDEVNQRIEKLRHIQ